MPDNDTQQTGYTEQSQSAFAEETVTVEKTKGNSGRLIMVVAGAFLLLMVALFAFNAYKKATTPVAAAQPTAVDPQTNAPPTDVAPADPALIDPNATPADPLSQDPVDPALQAPSDVDLFGGTPVTPQPANDPNAQPQFQDPGVQPAIVDPFGTGQQPQPATDPNSVDPLPQDPAPVQVTVQQSTQPPAATDAVTALDQVRNDIMAGFDELRRSIEALSDRQAKFETATNERFDNIDRRLTGVENGRPAASAAPTRKAAPVAAKPKPRAKPRAAPAPERRNTFEIIAPAPHAPAPSTVVMVQTAPAVLLSEQPAYVHAPASSFCPPSAVQPGRFWVRQPDGTFRTYGEGDRFGSGTISRIDPAQGIFVDGALVCAGR